MTIVYFVRHAQPNIDIYNDAMRPLSVKGLEDRKKLVLYFKQKKIDVAYSSPFKRAIETIDPIVKDKQISCLIDENLRERKIGNEWITNFNDYCKKQWENFEYHLSNGESLKKVQYRNIKALENIIEKNLNKTIIVGSHGTAIGTIINYYDSSFTYEKFIKIQPLMPFIIKAEFKGLVLKEYHLIDLDLF
uniref:histidine phosphatase family protein n=1 Tax=Lactobacillus taiwanensis TaxID=508451 RepID=UPI00255832F2|nr:histidine phosphatase family protein [Lactobacillus taiwanensis]